MKKSAQLQIRVSPQQKEAIRRAALRAGMDISSFVLSRVLSTQEERYHTLLRKLASAKDESFALAELSDFLENLDKQNFSPSLAREPKGITEGTRAYIASMIEHAARQKNALLPPWVSNTKALKEPLFGTELKTLRLGLLLDGPVAFRKRNIFIDSTVGDRV